MREQTSLLQVVIPRQPDRSARILITTQTEMYRNIKVRVLRRIFWLKRDEIFGLIKRGKADPVGSATRGVGLGSFGCGDCRVEPHLGHGCVYLVSVVCFQAEVFAASRSLIQRNPSGCGVCY
jgi:hypothetical protein